MKSILMLISSSPHIPESRQALELARTLLKEGNELGIFFLQDGVYHTLNATCAHQILSEEKIARYCLAEDLEMRGFGKEDVFLPVRLSHYDELVDLMMERYSTTIGAF